MHSLAKLAEYPIRVPAHFCLFPLMKSFPRVISAMLTAALIGGCYQVPVTGRRAVNLVDSKDVTKMSIAAFDAMKSQYRVSRDKDHIAQLNRVGERISKVVFWDMPEADWEFVVFDVPQQINAFAMAGGKVGIFTGLFKVVKNDDQLASVIAHEIAHVTAQHIHEKLSQEMAVNTVGTVGMVGLGASGMPLLSVGAIQAAYGLGTGVSGAAFDRSKEKEADYIGIMYMAKAGYNPEEAVKVLEQLEVEAGNQAVPAGFLSTHPSNPERILQLMDAMPKALEVRARSGQQMTPKLVK